MNITPPQLSAVPLEAVAGSGGPTIAPPSSPPPANLRVMFAGAGPRMVTAMSPDESRPPLPPPAAPPPPSPTTPEDAPATPIKGKAFRRLEAARAVTELADRYVLKQYERLRENNIRLAMDNNALLADKRNSDARDRWRDRKIEALQREIEELRRAQGLPAEQITPPKTVDGPDGVGLDERLPEMAAAGTSAAQGPAMDARVQPTSEPSQNSTNTAAPSAESATQ